MYILGEEEYWGGLGEAQKRTNFSLCRSSLRTPIHQETLIKLSELLPGPIIVLLSQVVRILTFDFVLSCHSPIIFYFVSIELGLGGKLEKCEVGLEEKSEDGNVLIIIYWCL